VASIPAAGFPDPKFFGPPGRSKGSDGKLLPKGQIITWVGLEDFADGIETFAKNVFGPARKGALTEIGLFGVRETKLRTPVQYGLLRASIGVFTGEDVKGSSSDPDGTSASDAAEAAHFVVATTGEGGSVEWGSNLEYAPWIEEGFTMRKRRLVYIDGVGFRWVNPFSYRGAHMFAAAAEATSKAVPTILSWWIEKAQKESEL
jgi:hypothetical protein